MDKQDMITIFAEHSWISRARAGRALDELFGRIAVAIAAGEAVRLPGLGAIEGYPTPARSGHNPRTGKAITIAAGHRFKFRPARALRDLAAAE